MCLIYRKYNNKYHYCNGGETMNLQDFLDEQERVNEKGFIVDNEQKANWALRKIKELQQEIEDNTRLAEKEIDKIERWKTKQNEQLADSVLYFESLLNDYAARKRAEDPNFKSMSLPNGRIGYRKQQPRWNYDDETLLKYLERTELDELIRVSKAPNKAEIRKQFEVVGDKVINTETGEVVEGIDIVHRDEVFNVRVE